MRSAATLLAAAALFATALATAQGAVTPGPVAPAAADAQAVLPAPAASRPLPPTRWTIAQIRQSFEFADSDANGELTRAEAQHLTIMPRTFEDMDENKDGVVSRAEYEAVFAP